MFQDIHQLPPNNYLIFFTIISTTIIPAHRYTLNWYLVIYMEKCYSKPIQLPLWLLGGWLGFTFQLSQSLPLPIITTNSSEFPSHLPICASCITSDTTIDQRHRTINSTDPILLIVRIVVVSVCLSVCTAKTHTVALWSWCPITINLSVRDKLGLLTVALLITQSKQRATNYNNKENIIHHPITRPLTIVLERDDW